MKTTKKQTDLETTSGAEAVDHLALKISREAPDLKDLTPEQLEAVARYVMMDRWASDLNHRVDMAGINYTDERKLFLQNAGYSNSIYTQQAYDTGLLRLEHFTTRKGIKLLDLTPKEADDFIYDRRASGASATMIRLDVAACSSFFTWMERRHEKAIRNPFRGTKARPPAETKKPILIPTVEEAAKISDRLTGEAWLAFQMAWLRGLRVGALPSLTITGKRFKARSKGKDISGEILDPELIAKIKNSGLKDLKEPFRDCTETQLADRIRKVTKKMHRAGEIAAAYSIHDFRHLYAITEYQKDKDLYRVMGLLNHTGIQTTEIYLKGLGIIGK